MDDKKRLIVLLSVLGLALVGGGIWFYMNMKGDEISGGGAEIIVPVFSKVDSIKKLTSKNIAYIDSDSSLINSFYKNERYRQLKDNSVEIIMFKVGNPEPFAPLNFASSTEEEDLDQ